MAASEFTRDLGDACEQIRRKRWDDAAGIALAVLDRDPDQFEALTILALARFATADVQSALIAATHLVRIHPHHCLGHHLRGLAFALNGEFLEALAAVRRGLHFDPNGLNALALMCELHLVLGDRDAARDVARYIRRMHPDSELAKDCSDKTRRRWRWNLRSYRFALDLDSLIAGVRSSLAWGLAS